MAALRVTAPVAAFSARGSSFCAPSRVVAAPAAAAGNACRAVTCMAKKGKDVRLYVTLECTEQKASGVAGISRYTTQKNRRNTPGRIELMKYNRYLRKYTLHRELKK